MHQLRGRILPPSHPHVLAVKEVLERLIQSSIVYDPKVRDLKWELHVVADDERNAFVLPGYDISQNAGIARSGYTD